MKLLSKLMITTALFAAVSLAIGCGQKHHDAVPTKVESKPAKSTAKTEDQHGHKAGSHGGIIIAVGADKHHIEAVFEKSGQIKLFTLGADEAKIMEVESQSLSAFIKAQNETDYKPMTFTAEPQAGDSKGKTSQFVGSIPKEYLGKQVTITVPNIRIGSDRYRFAFNSALPESLESHAEMPDKITDDAERELYLKPGGIYTKEDIAANGNTTATVKFANVKSSHEMKTKPGDKICPITETKANPKFTWIVAGKTYEFCCPPCVDEFVKMAKENPKEIKEPSFYVKQAKK